MEPTPIGVGFFVLVRGFPFGVFVFVSFETGGFPGWKAYWGFHGFPHLACVLATSSFGSRTHFVPLLIQLVRLVMSSRWNWSHRVWRVFVRFCSQCLRAGFLAVLVARFILVVC